VVVHAYNPRTWEVKARGSGVRGQYGLHSETISKKKKAKPNQSKQTNKKQSRVKNQGMVRPQGSASGSRVTPGLQRTKAGCRCQGRGFLGRTGALHRGTTPLPHHRPTAGDLGKVSSCCPSNFLPPLAPPGHTGCGHQPPGAQRKVITSTCASECRQDRRYNFVKYCSKEQPKNGRNKKIKLFKK
jgi:hypothetical protein